MPKPIEVVLVLGATGQQGGATARALLRRAVPVRALVRDPKSAKARQLAESGVELVAGDLADPASLERAAEGTKAVFSVQPSSGQPEYGVTDEDELRFGRSVVDAAQRAGVRHIVYTSVLGVGPDLGVGHFESKWRIEEYVRASGLAFTIIRPATFMELLLSPLFWPAKGTFSFFSAPGERFPFVAARDIGEVAALVLAAPGQHAGATLELAGDVLSGEEVAARFSRRFSRPIGYARFGNEIAAIHPAFARILELVDEGVFSGKADLAQLRALHPGLSTFDDWLDHGDADALRH